MVWISNGPAFSQGITDIIVTSNNNELMVSASYRGGFTPEIKKAIISGVSREFFYYIVLYTVMPNWMDEERISKTIRYAFKYDILKNQNVEAGPPRAAPPPRPPPGIAESGSCRSGIDKVN